MVSKRAGVEDARVEINWCESDVCMDVFCACGYSEHRDVPNEYGWKCPKCGTEYEFGKVALMIKTRYPADTEYIRGRHKINGGKELIALIVYTKTGE